MTVEALIASSVAGDNAAWMRLLGQLWELVDQRVRASRSMGQLRGSADDRREVVSRVFARLRHNEFRALRTFGAWHERNAERTFDDWLTIVVTNVIRDYIVERIGGDGLRRFVTTLAESLDADDTAESPRITNTLAARELLTTARAILPADQLAALASWLEGNDFAEVARALGWETAGVARASVRAALARLRREVREP
jgi:DNA-directed RNA polymerase specialized sigma24 family protein